MLPPLVPASTWILTAPGPTRPCRCPRLISPTGVPGSAFPRRPRRSSVFGWRRTNAWVTRAFLAYGSGDFHHLSALLVRRIPTPLTLVSFDNHPDWDIRPPRWCCGSWINRALDWCAREEAAVWGCGNFECWGWHSHLGQPFGTCARAACPSMPGRTNDPPPTRRAGRHHAGELARAFQCVRATSGRPLPLRHGGSGRVSRRRGGHELGERPFHRRGCGLGARSTRRLKRPSSRVMSAAPIHRPRTRGGSKNSPPKRTIPNWRYLNPPRRCGSTKLPSRRSGRH